MYVMQNSNITLITDILFILTAFTSTAAVESHQKTIRTGFPTEADRWTGWWCRISNCCILNYQQNQRDKNVLELSTEA